MTAKETMTYPSARLLKRARAGDRKAYDELFARVADRVLFFVRMRLGGRLRDKVDSLDVLQDVYMEAHKDLERFEHQGEGALARWLCRLVENRLRDLADHYAAKKRQPPGAALPVTAVLQAVRDSGTGPVTAAARIETRERLAKSMDHLEEEEREVLLLRFYQAKTYDEIAAATGRSSSAVRRLLGRALKSLGTKLEGEGECTDA